MPGYDTGAGVSFAVGVVFCRAHLLDIRSHGFIVVRDDLARRHDIPGTIMVRAVPCSGTGYVPCVVGRYLHGAGVARSAGASADGQRPFAVASVERRGVVSFCDP